MDALRGYGSDDTDDEDENENEAERSTPEHEHVDFFNLDPVTVKEPDDAGQPQTKRIKREFIMPSGLVVEVPTEDFWETASADDVKLKCATEKGTVTERHELHRQMTHTSQDTLYVKLPNNLKNFNRRERNIDFNKAQNKILLASTSTYREISQPGPGVISNYKDQTHINRGVHANGPSQLQDDDVEREQRSYVKTVTRNEDKCSSRKLFYVHSKIKPHLTARGSYRIPVKLDKDVSGHSGPVNRVKWGIPMYSHLLMSVSMDSSLKIWNFWSSLDNCVQVVNVHKRAVKDACWSNCGCEILSCGYDKMAVLSDVQTGKPLSVFPHDSYVNCIKCRPDDTNVFVSGSYNIIQAWDKRTPERPVREFIYKDKTGQVLDVIFSSDGSQVFSCCDLVSRDSADRNLMAWDFSSGVVLSNQIYQERYSCTRLKLHPTEGHFLAQTNGDYIAIFSVHKPYKLHRGKRFQGHTGRGYAVGFDLSADGSLVVSGSADGSAYFYNYHTGRLLRTLTTGLDVCMDVATHPVLTNTLVCCGWNGHIQVWR